MAFVPGIAAFQGGWAGQRRPAAAVCLVAGTRFDAVLPVLPDEPLLRLVTHALIEAVQAGPVAAKAGRIVKVVLSMSWFLTSRVTMRPFQAGAVIFADDILAAGCRIGAGLRSPGNPRPPPVTPHHRATYWLPVAPGWISLGFLQRGDYV